MLKRKKNFLLLEVLIGLSLILICLVPLINNPINYLLSEIKILEKIEYERISDFVFSDIKKDLLNNTIKWEHIPKEKDKPLEISFKEPISFSLKNIKTKKVTAKYSIKTVKEKISPEGNIYRLIDIKIILSPLSREKKNQTYQYNVFIQKITNNDQLK
jgi:hypothetical protein